MPESRLGYKPPSPYFSDLFLLLFLLANMHLAPPASLTAHEPCLRENLWGEGDLFKGR